LQIGHLLDRFPAELSGGERQRVALARALARRPAVMLLDEPLSSLDLPLRRNLRRELKQLQAETRVTTIYVTHDQAEALALGDRVAVLKDGRIEQIAKPAQVYGQPANRFVGEFFGQEGMNFLAGAVEASAGGMRFKAEGLSLKLDRVASPVPAGPIVLGFRAEDVNCSIEGVVTGIVRSTETIGSATYGAVAVADANENVAPVMIELRDGSASVKAGDRVAFSIQWDRAQWFDPGTGTRI
jgi:multiple sugar transport system ATP-binding protein